MSGIDRLLNQIKLHYDSFENVAHSYTPVKLDKKIKIRKEQIFGAIVQVMKFTTSYMQGTIERLGSNPTGARPFMFFPIIVFDGPMYEFLLDEGRPRIVEASHILVSSSLRPAGTLSERRFLIDVVTKEGFKPLLERIESDICQLTAYIKGLKKVRLSGSGGRVRVRSRNKK